MAAATIIKKSQKLQFLINGLTDHHEIWCDDAKWVSSTSRLLKNLNFKNLRWQTAANLKPYPGNRLTDFDEINNADCVSEFV